MDIYDQHWLQMVSYGYLWQVSTLRWRYWSA